MNCLGIDLGSSSIKGAILDLEQGDLLAVRSRPFPDPVSATGPGHFEVDPGAILKATQDLLEELLREAPDCRAVFFSSQMGGVILVNQQGRPTSNYLSWRDQRTVQESPSPGSLCSLRKRMGETSLREVGNELKPGSMTSLLFWLREQGFAAKGEMPLTLGGYIVAALCGGTPCTEPTEAIGTLDVLKGDFHQAAFRQIGLHEWKWPRLQTYEKPVGSRRIGGQDVPFHPAVGDHQCSLLGVGLQPRELSINVSTGSQVSLLTDQPRLGNWQSRAAFDGMFLNTITHLPAGRSLNALVDLLTAVSPERANDTKFDPWPVISRAVEQTADSDLDVNLSFFDGALGRRGHIGNISLENLTVGGLFHAAFRNMADNYQTCADRLRDCGEWDRIVLSGGLTQRMPRLRQLIQQRFDVPVRESPERDDTLQGLLTLAQRTYGTTKCSA